MKSSMLTSVVAFSVVVLASNAVAEIITYELVSHPAWQKGYSLTGTITTDGEMGTLAYADILSATIVVSDGTTSYQNLSPNQIYGVQNLLATETGLYLPLWIESNGFPSFSIGNTGYNLPRITYNYFDHIGGMYTGFSCDIPISTGLKVLWSTPNGYTNPLQLDGSPWLIATAVAEPSSFFLLCVVAMGLIAHVWRKR